ncbi:hypothetical protein D3C83_29120 [compost metagenome]
MVDRLGLRIDFGNARPDALECGTQHRKRRAVALRRAPCLREVAHRSARFREALQGMHARNVGAAFTGRRKLLRRERAAAVKYDVAFAQQAACSER